MRKLVLLAAVALLTAPGALAVEVAGILETDQYPTSIDSVAWYVSGNPNPVREATPGWGGQTQMTDTHQFRPLTDWPTMVELQYSIGSIPMTYTIDAPERNTWYTLPTFGDDQESQVMFKDSILLGIEQAHPMPHQARVTLDAGPNPFRSTVTIRLSASFPGRYSLSVSDRLGRVVASLVPAGSPFRFVWDGRASGGERLAPGVYVVRAWSGAKAATIPVILTR